MEDQLPLDKEIVYGAALLHDIGRDRQYEEQIPHHQASAEPPPTFAPHDTAYHLPSYSCRRQKKNRALHSRSP